MIFHPGALALLVGGGIMLLMLIYAGAVGARIVLSWDLAKSTARQLSLERETYLVSTIVNYALGFSVVSVFLFLHTADEIHNFFAGAMCATGSLNANPIGWWALATKILFFFVGGTWIAMNHLDQQAEDYPLVRRKYLFLLAICPLATADLVLTYRYFAGLNPEVITSCCGSLFSSAEGTVTSVVAAMPLRPSVVFFYGTSALLAALLVASLKWPSPATFYAIAAAAPPFLAAAITGTIVFVAPHIYELPFHHCPFDVLQREYRYIGYPLFASLFFTTLFSLIPGCIQPFANIPSLRAPARRIQQRCVRAALMSGIIFLGITSYPLLSSNLLLWGY